MVVGLGWGWSLNRGLNYNKIAQNVIVTHKYGLLHGVMFEYEWSFRSFTASSSRKAG
jgi:hypothetical protein